LSFPFENCDFDILNPSFPADTMFKGKIGQLRLVEINFEF
jgi:hypothetical protein